MRKPFEKSNKIGSCHAKLSLGFKFPARSSVESFHDVTRGNRREKSLLMSRFSSLLGSMAFAVPCLRPRGRS